MSREFRESPVKQGVDEEITYTLDTSAWGSSPTGVTVKVYDVTTLPKVDVTATVMPVNSPAVSNDIISCSPLKLLTVGHAYRIEVKFASAGNVFEAYGIVQAEE